MTPAEVETQRKTHAALVKSPFVVCSALRDPKVRDLDVVGRESDAVAWLTSHLTVEYSENSAVLRVCVTGVPPREAALLANAVASAYLNEVVQKDVQALRSRGQKLEEAHAELTKALDAQRKALNHLATEAGVPPNAADQRALLAALYQERAGLRVELAKARADKNACPEPGEREKLLRDELATLDTRIKSCEQADLDTMRGEVARLETAASTVASEQTRLQMDLNSPPRTTLLAYATVPE